MGTRRRSDRARASKNAHVVLSVLVGAGAAGVGGTSGDGVKVLDERDLARLLGDVPSTESLQTRGGDARAAPDPPPDGDRGGDARAAPDPPPDGDRGGDARAAPDPPAVRRGRR